MTVPLDIIKVLKDLKPFVFIISSLYEPNVDAVVTRLEQRNVPWFRFNTESFPLFCKISLCLSADQTYATITSKADRIDTRRVTSVWNRRHSDLVMPDGLTEIEKNFVKGECVSLLHGLYDSLSVRWVNSRTSEYRANVKSYQQATAKLIGLSIPDTLMTNDPEAVRRLFAGSKKPILFKPIGGAFASAPSRNAQALTEAYGEPAVPVQAPAARREDSNVAVFSEMLTEERLGEIDNIAFSPVTFQQYVEKDVELRITIVGDLVFAAEIHSQELESTKVDFRHLANGPVPSHRIHKLPDDIETKLMQLMSRLGLVFGCIDMILTPEGEYVFLEVNPAGQWGWIEKYTGLPITDALTDLLVGSASD